MGEILASELQKKNSADIFKFMDSRAPFDFGADAMLSDGAYYPNAVQDYDGNWYDAVIIGNLVWTVQNLRTTHFPDGEEIPVGSDASVMAPYCYNKTSSSIDIKKRGLLYNWAAIMCGESSSSAVPSGVQGVAPNGWHIPSKAEIDALIAYLKTQKRYVAGDDDDNIGKALAASEIWSTSSVANAVGNDKTKNNYSGFNAIPSGIWDEGFDSEGSENFIATTTIDDNYVYGLSVRNNLAYPVVSQYRNYYGMSVRCLCNMSPVEFRTWYIKTYSGYPHIINTNETEEVFMCTFNGTSMNKTAQEIYEASQAGKVVVCTYENRKYYLEKTLLNSSAYELQFISMADVSTAFKPSVLFYHISYKNQTWSSGTILPEEVVYATTSNYNSVDETIEVSMTPLQISTAVGGNKSVLLKHGDGVYVLTWTGSSPRFECLNMSTLRTIAYYESDSKWHLLTTQLATSSQADKLLVCTYNATLYTMDKTYQEIVDAYNAGKVVICKHGNLTYYLSVVSESSSMIVFTQTTNVEGNTPSLAYIKYLNNAWSHGSKTVQQQLIDNGANQNIKTVNNQSLLGSGNISIPNGVLHCVFTFNTGSTTTGTIDKTTTEILAAANDGKEVICSVTNSYEIFNLVSKNTLMFCMILAYNVKYLQYDSVNDNWSYSSISLQGHLVSGANIKTVNNNNLLGSGNVTIPEGIYSDISVSDSSIDGSVYEIIKNSIKCLRLTDNQTTFNIGITGVTNGFTFRVIIDNSVNVNDTVITLSTGSATNVVLSPELETVDGRTVKAGEKIGFEFVSSSTLVVVTKLFGGSTMDEEIMYSQIPIDNDTY